MVSRSRILGWIIVLLCMGFVGTGMAQTIYTWTQASGGTQSWENSSNWSAGVPSPAAGDTISINLTQLAQTYMNLESNRTFGAWSTSLGGFDSKLFTISSGYKITLVDTNMPVVTVNGGNGATLYMACLLAGTNGLKKSGSQTLSLNNPSNTFSGGIELEDGTLVATEDGCFGDPDNTIVVTGDAALSLADGQTYSPDITINDGITLRYGDIGTVTLGGAITGPGGIQISASGFGSQNVTFSNTNNSFTGEIKLGQGDTGVILTVNSLADSTNALELVIGSKNVTQFRLGSGAIAPLVLNNRRLILSGTVVKNDHVIENANTNPANSITISQDVSITATADRSLVLQGVNTGDNTLAGMIPDGVGSITSLEKAGSGKWVLAGENTFTGPTTVSAGTLKLAASDCLLDSGTLTIDGGRLELGKGVRERIDNLVLGATTQTTNTSYGASSSAAEIKNDIYFSGEGMLYLGMYPPPQGTVIIVR